ncbi:MAG: RsmB/NOP family class I SAM-dependent RNA methyltransferase [Desulfovibrio aminophilus]|jgi:16S rRNA (cytosine1407-C5)-methyltransferase|uniref:RsmB/NOP family class I SAM-dependent RNA methyltransferase n=1 Tax=Desulfovibrio aminophilus TaxID=81425 RepID=UPI002A3922F3|nr:RsmB/NOP family class I SAM-dependent RNA methyltransferase [Desulfovibrionaceae bacterium]
MGHSLRSFRLVGGAAEAGGIEDLLRAQGFAFEPEPFWPLARRLTGEPFPLGGSLAARFGRVYIQDRSSMLPPLLLAPPPGAVVLDMCASPGSKTGLLSQMVGSQGFVLAVEASADRLATLRANLRRMGAANTATIGLSSERLPLAEGSFDHILLDPPCSGWGTAERNPKVLELWSGDKTAPLVRLQRVLLAKAAALLAPGGRLLYSTCTTNVEENEEQTAWALSELDLEPAPLSPPPGFVFDAPLLGLDGVLRVAEESQGQGFYLAAFTRRGGGRAAASERAALPGKRLNPARLATEAPVDWEALPPGQIHDFNGKVYFLHERALELLPQGLRWQGFALGKTAAGVFRPDPLCRPLLPSLASLPVGRVFDAQEPAELEALLSGQAVPCGEGKGPAALYYRGLSLGFVGRKGRRFLWTGAGL